MASAGMEMEMMAADPSIGARLAALYVAHRRSAA
jgi:hypothetical protein